MLDIDIRAPRMLDTGELAFTVQNRPLAMRFCLQAEPGKVYTARIGHKRTRRSLDANAYFWALAGKLAAATGVPKTEVYRNAIREIGDNSTTVCVVEKAVKKLVDSWQQKGVGWLADTIPSRIEGCVNVTLYYGSSTYNSRQMARLIDNIVQDCQACGIETLTPAELARLKDDWGAANVKK